MYRSTCLSAVVAVALLAPAPASADVVQDWTVIMLNTIKAQTPFAQARFAAITELAVFEAVNACTGDYQPYLGSIHAPRGASADAAAIAAASAVLKSYFPASGPALDLARAQSLAAIRNGPHKDDGVAVGDAAAAAMIAGGAPAAAAMIAARANDGSSPLQTFLPASTDPGVWQLTPPAFGPGLFRNWGGVTPFGVRSTDQFRPSPPPALTSPQYTRSYDEVKRVGEINSTERPQDRTDVARVYAAIPPTQVFNTVALQVTAARHLTLPESARAFALLNMAISDALFSVFEAKYFYVAWRPVTAIRAGDTDGNPQTEPDTAWTPLITTPSFPGYPSAHGTGSGAGRAVLERLFGPEGHDVTLSTAAVPGVTLHYTNFRDITDDIADARVYGGIHFRFDQEAGAEQGRRIGRYVYKHQLQPLHGTHHD